VAVLLVTLESPGLEIDQLNVTVAATHGRGMTGIRNVSTASGAIVVVLVHVTVTHTVAPHDHPLSVNGLVGHEILVGRVSMVVCTPDEARFPALVHEIGI
jgi:hypothetical protein